MVYGSFTSNVDMKSGSPAFGTPEYVKAAFGAGQLARFLGLPWRSSNATASNIPDAQSAYESQMSLWGALLGGCNFVLHAAGWLESGLTTSYEKFILDIEMLQMFAEVFQPVGAATADLALEAVAEVGAGRPFLRLCAHHGALSQRVLCAAGLRLAQFRQLGGGWRQNGHRARHRYLAERPCSVMLRRRAIRPSSRRWTPMWRAAQPKAALRPVTLMRMSRPGTRCRRDITSLASRWRLTMACWKSA